MACGFVSRWSARAKKTARLLAGKRGRVGSWKSRVLRAHRSLAGPQLITIIARAWVMQEQLRPDMRGGRSCTEQQIPQQVEGMLDEEERL